jgi:hypothetical protein
VSPTPVSWEVTDAVAVGQERALGAKRRRQKGAGEEGAKVTAADSFSSTITNTYRTWNLPPIGDAAAEPDPSAPAYSTSAVRSRVRRGPNTGRTRGRLTSDGGHGNQI